MGQDIGSGYMPQPGGATTPVQPIPQMQDPSAMVSPGDSPTQMQNLARGMDPTQGSYGAGGQAKQQMTPQPVNPQAVTAGAATPGGINQMIAQLLMKLKGGR